MSVEKRFYDYNECNFIVIEKENAMIIFNAYDESKGKKELLFEVVLESETALELSKELYHKIKNLKNGGKNE
jgi:hypothetical protein